MSNYPQYSDRARSMKVRDCDTMLSWVAAITVLIVIMAVVIGHIGYVDVAKTNPRSFASTMGAASPLR
jgi:hypothetical protein